MVLPRVEKGIFGSIKSQTFKRLNRWQLHFTRVSLNVFFPMDLPVFSPPLSNSHPEFQIQVNLKS